MMADLRISLFSTLVVLNYFYIRILLLAYIDPLKSIRRREHAVNTYNRNLPVPWK